VVFVIPPAESPPSPRTGQAELRDPVLEIDFGGYGTLMEVFNILESSPTTGTEGDQRFKELMFTNHTIEELQSCLTAWFDMNHQRDASLAMEWVHYLDQLTSESPNSDFLTARRKGFMRHCLTSVGIRGNLYDFPDFTFQTCKQQARSVSIEGESHTLHVLIIDAPQDGTEAVALIKDDEVLTIKVGMHVTRHPNRPEEYVGSGELLILKKVRPSTVYLNEDHSREMKALWIEDHIREMKALMWLKQMNAMSPERPKIIFPRTILEDENHQSYYMVLPKMKFDLNEYFNDILTCRLQALQKLYYRREELERFRDMHEAEVIHMIYDICRSLQWLKTLGIAHHDISLENIVVDERLRCWLIDLGRIIKLPRLVRPNTVVRKLQPGVDFTYGRLEYTSPERMDPSRNAVDLYKEDMFAVGLVAYQLLLVWPLQRGKYNSPEDLRRKQETTRSWLGLSDEATTLLQNLLERDPDHRAGPEEICDYISREWQIDR